LEETENILFNTAAYSSPEYGFFLLSELIYFKLHGKLSEVTMPFLVLLKYLVQWHNCNILMCVTKGGSQEMVSNTAHCKCLGQRSSFCFAFFEVLLKESIGMTEIHISLFKQLIICLLGLPYSPKRAQSLCNVSHDLLLVPDGDADEDGRAGACVFKADIFLFRSFVA